MADLRDLLNRARFAEQNLGEYKIVARHRGAPNNQVTILGSEIERIRPDGLLCHPGAENENSDNDGEVSLVPYHRILKVTGPTGDVIYEKPRPNV